MLSNYETRIYFNNLATNPLLFTGSEEYIGNFSDKQEIISFIEPAKLRILEQRVAQLLHLTESNVHQQLTSITMSFTMHINTEYYDCTQDVYSYATIRCGPSEPFQIRPVKINSAFQCKLKQSSNSSVEISLLSISSYDLHSRIPYSQGIYKPFFLNDLDGAYWKHSSTTAALIPIQCLFSKCAKFEQFVNHEKVYQFIPLPRSFAI